MALKAAMSTPAAFKQNRVRFPSVPRNKGVSSMSLSLVVELKLHQLHTCPTNRL